MLLLYLIPLIDVTFSTPTRFFANRGQNEFKRMCAKKQIAIKTLEMSRLRGLRALARKFDKLGWT